MSLLSRILATIMPFLSFLLVVSYSYQGKWVLSSLWSLSLALTFYIAMEEWKDVVRRQK